jgi:hypothetical protein
MIKVGKSVHDIFMEELSKGSYDFRNNKHLEVVLEPGLVPFIVP